MDSPSSVSVIIPCYNGERYLRETLESALAQTQSPLEVLVVDDGSTDRSAAIAEAFGPPVRVIRQPNQGESVARNRGIDEAHGEWVAFLDADDLWKPEKLARQLDTVAADVVGVHTDLFLCGDRTGTVSCASKFGDDRYRLERLAVRNAFMCGSTLMVRRATAPRFPTWTRYAEDQVFCLELVRRGRVVLVEEPLTGYRIHSQSQSQSQQRLVVTHWHATIMQWLARQDGVSQTSLDEIQAGWARLFLNTLRQCRKHADWDSDRALRTYLKAYRRSAAINEVLREAQWPGWAYATLQRARALKRRTLSITRGASVFGKTEAANR